MKNSICLLALIIFLLGSMSCRKNEPLEPTPTGSITPTTPITPTAPIGLPVMPALPALGASAVTSGNGGEPYETITFQFPSDGILKMIDMGVIQSDMNEYFSATYFYPPGGYYGLQQTSNNAWGTPYIAISSLWNGAGGNSNVDYTAPKITGQPFIGEGTGKQTIGAYAWQINHWYRMAARAWQVGTQLYVGTFIQDMSVGTWMLFSVTDINNTSGKFLGTGSISFIENWDRTGGRTPRAAYFKDAWNMNAGGGWESPTSAEFYAFDISTPQSQGSGDFINSFNAFYDPNVDGYLMAHGGDVKPGPAFKGGRSLDLQLQKNQGTTPQSIVPGVVKSVTASYSNNQVLVSWVNDLSTSPQLSCDVQIIDSFGTIVGKSSDTKPWITSVTIPAALNSSNTYTAKVVITDIFNQKSVPAQCSVTK